MSDTGYIGDVQAEDIRRSSGDWADILVAHLGLKGEADECCVDLIDRIRFAAVELALDSVAHRLRGEASARELVSKLRPYEVMGI